MIDKIELLIDVYKNINKKILIETPNIIDCDGFTDNSLNGIKFHLNEIFIKELQDIIYGRGY